MKAPVITGSYPKQASVDVSLLPVLSLYYNEPLESSTVFDRIHLETQDTGTHVEGSVRYWQVGEKGVISFFPAVRLEPIIFIPYDNQADTDYFLEVQWVKQYCNKSLSAA